MDKKPPMFFQKMREAHPKALERKKPKAELEEAKFDLACLNLVGQESSIHTT